VACLLLVSPLLAEEKKPKEKPPPPTAAQLLGWMADLGSRESLKREQAALALFRSGEAAGPILQKAAEGSPGPLAARARRLLRCLRWRIHPGRRDLWLLMEGFEERRYLGKLGAIHRMEKMLDVGALDVVIRISQTARSARIRDYAARSAGRILFRLGGGRGDLLTALNTKGCDLLKTKKYDEAIKQFDKMLEIAPKNSTALYNKACAYSLKGDVDRAIDFLRQAVANGFRDREHIEGDADLENVRKDPRYRKIVAGLDYGGDGRKPWGDGRQKKGDD
jgi:tetratricopeptide (TPR) repeat protein